jgi:hypothetical protein
MEMVLPEQPFGPAPEVRKGVRVESAQLNQYAARGSKVKVGPVKLGEGTPEFYSAYFVWRSF